MTSHRIAVVMAAVAGAFGVIVLVVRIWAATAPRPAGVGTGTLGPCPSSPNCVSSRADDRQHAIVPLTCRVADAAERGRLLAAAVAALPGTEVRTVGDGYLYAVSRSRVLGFRDDLELTFDRSDQVQVRSGSRRGTSDLGANRDRVEALRMRLDRLCDG